MKISLNVQVDNFVYRSDLETSNPTFFLSKSSRNAVIILHLEKLSTLTIAKMTTSTRTDIMLQTSMKLLRAITMCSTFTPDCRYDKSLINLITNVFCPNTMSSGILCLDKKTFHSLPGSDYQ